MTSARLVTYTLAVACLIAAILLGISLVNKYETINSLQAKFFLLQNIGQVRKTLTYLSLFSFRLVSGHPDYTYDVLVASESVKFYQLSSLTHKELDHIFRDVYGHI